MMTWSFSIVFCFCFFPGGHSSYYKFSLPFILILDCVHPTRYWLDQHYRHFCQNVGCSYANMISSWLAQLFHLYHSLPSHIRLLIEDAHIFFSKGILPSYISTQYSPNICLTIFSHCVSVDSEQMSTLWLLCVIPGLTDRIPHNAWDQYWRVQIINQQHQGEYKSRDSLSHLSQALVNVFPFMWI